MDDLIEIMDQGKEEKRVSLSHLSDLYEKWFLDYASYVILERAIPALEDGLKPVQRRILHAMWETNDGRFHKVANIIGNTMQYHPHGDAAIGEAIVNIGQKNLLIDTQGNWGDVVTGDRAAAARYIEARLSKFALEVCFNPDITEWQASYDGRKKEPVMLPVKFPLLLALGAEGIAVGLATKILPHNFQELILATISYLKEKEFVIYPDFNIGGLADFSAYNQGGKGSRVRVRSKIEVIDKKTLAIRSIPFGVTTVALIESIVKANDQGKIKIRQITDNTAQNVEILIELHKDVSVDVSIDALYAFTDCEATLYPNACVIWQEKPVFLNVHDCLKLSTDYTLELLKRELEVRQAQLQEKWHFASLEKIFIEKKIYRDIENCETWESVIDTIDNGLKPHIQHLKREVTRDDIANLTEIKIKRISKFDATRADQIISNIEAELDELAYNLRHLKDYAIEYFEGLLQKYGKGRERKTEIRTFDTIEAKTVVMSNRKLYVNRKEGFAGYGLKKEEPVTDCSELDDIIAFRKDGKFIIKRVGEKVFFGKDIIWIGVFNKDDERITYNVIYLDGKTSRAMIKRFNVTSVMRDKEYDLTQGTHGSRLIYITVNPLGETEVITVFLAQNSKARIKVFDFDMAKIAVKGKSSIGNILTKYAVRKIIRKSVQYAGIKGVDYWYDENIGKLFTRETGKYLGSFTPDDLVLALYNDGQYELTTADPMNHYDIDKLAHIEQFLPERPVTTIYFHNENQTYYVKRFNIETTTTGKLFKFISEVKGSFMSLVSTGTKTVIKIDYLKGKKEEKHSEVIELSEFVDVMGWRATGKKLSPFKITGIKVVDIIYEEESVINENVDENETVEAIDAFEDPEIPGNIEETIIVQSDEDISKEQGGKAETVKSTKRKKKEVTSDEAEIAVDAPSVKNKKSKSIKIQDKGTDIIVDEITPPVVDVTPVIDATELNEVKEEIIEVPALEKKPSSRKKKETIIDEVKEDITEEPAKEPPIKPKETHTSRKSSPGKKPGRIDDPGLEEKGINRVDPTETDPPEGIQLTLF
jgi:topoisomerase IV subunit A